MVKSKLLTASLGLVIVIIGFFFLGFKVGLFLFQQEMRIDADSAKGTDQSRYISENLRGNPRKSALKENFCLEGIEFLNEDDKKFCFQESKLTESRGLEVDLTSNKVLLYDQGKLIKIFPLSYQAPEGKWYQAPTGYYRAGVKHEKHFSSLFPVVMPYSVQYYEDFFIHGIPYYRDGKNVSSNFTGGCLRFKNDIAKEIYEFLKTGDQIVVYKTFDDLKIKPGFQPPVDLESFFIERRFLNAYRQSRLFGGIDALKKDYYQHTGADFAPNAGLRKLNAELGRLDADLRRKLNVYAIYDGKIAKIQLNDGDDHGLGNTMVIEHLINSEKIYSLYAHLASIETSFKEGDIIKKGEVIGEVGSSGFGCQNYWRIGEDACPELAEGQTNNNPDDTHLHFEIKKAPVLENPRGNKFYYGYTPDYPQKYGYLNPIEFLFMTL